MMPRKLVVLTTSLTGGAIGLFASSRTFSSLCRWLAGCFEATSRPPGMGRTACS
jgi:hypothetical protein